MSERKVKPKVEKKKSTKGRMFTLSRTKKTTASESPSESPRETVSFQQEMTSPQSEFMKGMHQQFIAKKVLRRRNEYSAKEELKIFLGTWNLNAKKPKEDLGEWLSDKSADIYVLGFQEIVDLNAKNLAMDHSQGAVWEKHIEKYIPKNFRMVSSRHLVGISMCVFVSPSVIRHVNDIDSQQVGTGILGVGGNKGAVAIKIRVYDTTILFVCAHLAARKKRVAQRNHDFETISQRLSFEGSTDTEQKTQVRPTKFFDDFDNIFWIGDLNYRLNIDMEHLDDVFDNIENGNLDYLLERDQLLIEKAAGRVFGGFSEGKITFAPTYKYQPGTDVYERREDKKKRMPAWCDRILYKGSGVTQHFYKSTHGLLASDHKPVSSLLSLQCLREIPEKKEAVTKEVVTMLDRLENDQLPKITVTPSIIDVGEIRYGEVIKKTLTVFNEGEAIVEWEFVSTPDSKTNAIAPSWLEIEPKRAIVAPQDSVEIELTICVKDAALDLILDNITLEDVLILRLKRGRDFFVAVSGGYVKSCFGASLLLLVNTREPIRNVDFTKKNAQGVPVKPLNVPKELWRIVDHIYRAGLNEEGLFVQHGQRDEIEQIKECLDTGTAFPCISVHSMAECLLIFLQSLHTPVLSLDFLDTNSQTHNLGLEADQALNTMTPSQYNTFTYLTCFMREVLKSSENNKISLASMVVLFSSCIMQVKPTSKEYRQTTVWKIARHYLITSDL